MHRHVLFMIMRNAHQSAIPEQLQRCFHKFTMHKDDYTKISDAKDAHSKSKHLSHTYNITAAVTNIISKQLSHIKAAVTYQSSWHISKQLSDIKAPAHIKAAVTYQKQLSHFKADASIKAAVTYQSSCTSLMKPSTFSSMVLQHYRRWMTSQRL